MVPCVAVRYVGDWKSRERERDARGKLTRTKRREEKEEETLDQAAQAFGDASWSQATNLTNWPMHLAKVLLLLWERETDRIDGPPATTHTHTHTRGADSKREEEDDDQGGRRRLSVAFLSRSTLYAVCYFFLSFFLFFPFLFLSFSPRSCCGASAK